MSEDKYAELDDVAARLEDLALELDCDELQGLAHTLTALGSKPCMECQKGAHKNRIVDMLIRDLIGTGLITPEMVYGYHGMYPPGKNPPSVNFDPSRIYSSTILDPNKPVLDFNVT